MKVAGIILCGLGVLCVILAVFCAYKGVLAFQNRDNDGAAIGKLFFVLFLLMGAPLLMTGIVLLIVSWIRRRFRRTP